MDTFFRDIRIGFRVLLKERSFCALAVTVLALGICGVTAMFSVVNGVLLQRLPFPHAERIVDINEVERRDMAGGGAIAPATFVDWQKMATTFDAMSAYGMRTYNVTPNSGEPVRLRDLVDVDADHGLAEAAGDLGDDVGVVVEGGRLDDRLGAFGNQSARTPAIDSLAADGVTFERAYAHVPQTLPAHAAILTGRLPFETGVRDAAGPALPAGPGRAQAPGAVLKRGRSHCLLEA